MGPVAHVLAHNNSHSSLLMLPYGNMTSDAGRELGKARFWFI